MPPELSMDLETDDSHPQGTVESVEDRAHVKLSQQQFDELFQVKKGKLKLEYETITKEFCTFARIVINRWRFRYQLCKGYVKYQICMSDADHMELERYDHNNLLLTLKSLDTHTIYLLQIIGQIELVLPPLVLQQIREGSVRISSPHNLWGNRIRVSCTDIRSITEIFSLLLSQTLYPQQGAIPRACQTLQPTSLMPVVGKSVVPEIVSEELELNKLQISFIIGENGCRIEQIKHTSCAVIKVLPIQTKLQAQDIRNPESVHQNLAITGQLAHVTKAIIIIQAYLDLYEINKKHKF